jgi:hypothetical protein
MLLDKGLRNDYKNILRQGKGLMKKIGRFTISG